MGVRWQACWTVTTGDTVDWYEYDRCLRGFSYPLRKPATADCARSLARSPDAPRRHAVSLAAADPLQHGAHTRTVPVDLDAQAACSQPRRARQLLDTLLRTARSDEASTSKALTAPRQRVSGSTEPVERRQTPGRLHRTRPLDESETAARAASRAARQPGLK